MDWRVLSSWCALPPCIKFFVPERSRAATAASSLGASPATDNGEYDQGDEQCPKYDNKDDDEVS